MKASDANQLAKSVHSAQYEMDLLNIYKKIHFCAENGNFELMWNGHILQPVIDTLRGAGYVVHVSNTNVNFVESISWK